MKKKQQHRDADVAAALADTVRTVAVDGLREIAEADLGMHNLKCAQSHFGPWMIEAAWFRSAVESVKSGILKAQPPSETDEDEDDDDDSGYKNVGGVALVSIAGAMMKAKSKYGGTSTVDTRVALRKAAQDDSVYAILIQFDSPGGTVAGTDALARDVAAINQRKPVYAHAEDMCCSAGYYVACQARRFTASPTSLIGSLGTRLVLVDSSKAAEMDGLKVYDISSGEFKGAGLDGTEITDKQLAYFQGIVDDMNAHFVAAVMRGRSMSQQTAEALFDGRIHDAAKAQQLGLIDAVSSLDATMTAILQEISTMNADQFTAYAAEHPEAVAKFVEQGKKAGATEARDQEIQRAKSLADACGGPGGGWKLAMQCFIAGQDAATAKIAADAAAEVRVKAEADAAAHAQAIAAKDAEIAALQKQAGFVKGEQAPVATRATADAPATQASANDDDPGDDAPVERRREWANAKSAAEWDKKNPNAARFSTKERYVAFRSQELLGNMKTLMPAAK